MMKYIMVTDFDGHWDNIKGNFTSYSPKMVKKRCELISDIETIFIKKYKDSNEVEKTWSGKVKDIQKVPGSIFFRVEIKQEIECPKKYLLNENGWYVED